MHGQPASCVTVMQTAVCVHGPSRHISQGIQLITFQQWPSSVTKKGGVASLNSLHAAKPAANCDMCCFLIALAS